MRATPLADRAYSLSFGFLIIGFIMALVGAGAACILCFIISFGYSRVAIALEKRSQ